MAYAMLTTFISFNYEEFYRIVATRRNASAPGLNGIPYKVYKKCTNICAYLFNVFKCCFKNCVVPIQRLMPESQVLAHRWLSVIYLFF